MKNSVIEVQNISVSNFPKIESDDYIFLQV